MTKRDDDLDRAAFLLSAWIIPGTLGLFLLVILVLALGALI